MINKYNSMNIINLDKEISNNPYIFIPYMLYMNKNLESNNSKKNIK